MEITHTLSTKELCSLVSANKNKFVETRLFLNGGFATHFLFCNDTNLYNEGIDGEIRKTSFDNFQKLYPNCLWNIDNIV